MKNIIISLATLGVALSAHSATVIPSRTDLPFFRMYEGVKLKPSEGVASVSVSKLVKDFSNTKKPWSLEVGSSRRSIDITLFNQLKALADATVVTEDGDGTNKVGTAYHVGGGYFLTNQHVLSSTRENTTKCKNFKAKTGDDDHSFKCKEVVYCNKTADFCLIEMKASKPGRREPSNLPAFIIRGERHPDLEGLYGVFGNTDAKGIHFSRGKGIVEVGSAFNFYAPVSGGNSGGPLINEQGEVIGTVKTQSEKGGIDEKGFNSALRSDFILKDLKSHIGSEHVFFKTATIVGEAMP